MIPSTWLSAFANHLWQSTIFAAVAAVLAFALRSNQARARYWLWLVASLKFLLPFSLLVAMGSHVSWHIASSIPPAKLSPVVEQITQPFPQAGLTPFVAPLSTTHSTGLLPVIFVGIWLCGVLAVSFSYIGKWRRIRSAVRAASPLSIAAHVPVLSSATLLEPGVFGIFTPILLLPEGITARLTPEHLEAILAHELCHVRRRDNLAAALHMLVECVFWFHPLVWWIGTRLVAERERACDEEVVRLGNQPGIYAESILRTCQFYLESPLACVSGVTGSDLKKRIVHIMTQSIAARLTLRKKLLLAAAAITAVALPVAAGLLHAGQNVAQSQPAPSFEVVSIKQSKPDARSMFRIGTEPGGRFMANNVTLKTLLQIAYHVKEDQISGVPAWISSEHYDIEAKPEDVFADEARKLSSEQRDQQFMLMLQSMLADRFSLALRRDTKDLPVYVLTVMKNGPKFHETAGAPADAGTNSQDAPGPQMRRRGIMMGRGELTLTDASIDMFDDALSHQLGRVVINKTGLQGRYDFTLKWTPDESQGQMAPGDPQGPGAPPPPDPSGPSIFTALQEQLGLKLEAQKAPLDVLVIEHVEKPSEN